MSNLAGILDYAAKFRERHAERKNRLLKREPVALPKVSGYPMYSDAAGVNPDQIEEQMEMDRQLGVPTEYTEDGLAIFTDPLHRKRYCEAYGLYDRNCFGGGLDPQHGGRN